MISLPALHILHVVPSSPYGGMQRLVAQLATEQIERGTYVQVLALYDDPVFSADLLARAIPFVSTGGKHFNLRGCWQYVARSNAIRPTIVHLHMGLLWSNILGLTTKRCPWIGHLHTYPIRPKTLKQKSLSAVNRTLCDAYIGVSQSVSKRALDILGSSGIPIHTVSNGIELPKGPLFEHSQNFDRPVYGMATRFGEDKGIWEFVQVAEIILTLQPAARFILAGDGPLFPHVRSYLSKRFLSEYISIPGHISKVTEFWRQIDVALFTAPCEAFGLRLVEPMANGTPVVAYRTGCGSDELVTNEVTGLQADWGDAYGLAKQCVRLTTDAQLWRTISLAGVKEVSEKYTIQAMAAHIEAIYDATLAASANGGGGSQ